ncbi:uncharacterized protein Dvar_73660 [Desulfosarcina variabilis str. Montpellier]
MKAPFFLSPYFLILGNSFFSAPYPEISSASSFSEKTGTENHPALEPLFHPAFYAFSEGSPFLQLNFS